MRTIQLFITVSLVSCSFAVAEESKKTTHSNPYTFKPLLMDSANNTGTVLGIEYGVSKEWKFSESDPKPNANGDFAPVNGGKGFAQDHGFLSGETHGNWTSDKDKNPKNLATIDTSLGYRLFRTQYSIDIAAKVGIEGDQSYSNNQKTYSGQILSYYDFTGQATTYLEILLGYGQVDAEKDDVRKALTDKAKFDRANGEIYLNIRLPEPKAGTPYAPNRIGFNYRYFKETSAPVEIKDANLDEYQYGGVHLSFEKGFYLAYTAGKLPFNEKNDRIFSIGFSQNLF